MKKLILTLHFILLGINVQAQGILFFEGSWADLLKEAMTQKRPLFVDVYTGWCGPCKKMAKEIFTRQEVGDYFNAHFINYKIDAEKGEGIEIAARFNVSAYPTCLFVTSEGKLISSFLGAQTAEKLIKEGEKAMKNFALLPEIERLDAAYKEGNRELTFLQEYCSKRSEFGENGGQPVNDLLVLMPDTALSKKENVRWIEHITIFNDTLLERCIHRLRVMDKGDKRKVNALNKAIMRALSTLLNQAMEGNLKAEFDHLIGYKAQMTAIDKQNQENEIMASMGGGISYIAPEQIKLSFYAKHRYDAEFSALFLDYLHRNMKEHPIQQLISKADEDERTYADFLKSDTVSEEVKREVERGRGLMKLFSGIHNKVLSSSLFNAAEHYWELNAPQSTELKGHYIDWLQFFYALAREASIAIPVAQRLAELGETAQAKAMLENLSEFLTVKGDPEKELSRVKEALAKY
ncbi:thioredoxin family protein [Bacteroides pyogenes]|uniref:thioredoxin family protein n=1 Tax=Bacteroides pyogenes TaxID=310300 RepID=UPI004062BD27